MLSTDPTDIALDADDDLDIENGGRLVYGNEGVAQGIKYAVNLHKGEWFADLLAGIPWAANDVVTDDEAILGNPVNEQRIRDEVRKTIAAVPGVKTIESISFDFNARTRKLSMSWEVKTTFDDTVISGEESI